MNESIDRCMYACMFRWMDRHTYVCMYECMYVWTGGQMDNEKMSKKSGQMIR